ncbi:hypothetical protein NYF23_08255 [SAR92 clade bacterium H455]|uniref:YHYH protein n=1 Tax=SAR92 clade bacterium H455 TaxID=2974818 RepID=A0ABY5TJI4_9GAMM|nr:hypothetical protein NYF23_08255 [SAR92 clade bacterium H455]
MVTSALNRNLKRNRSFLALILSMVLLPGFLTLSSADENSAAGPLDIDGNGKYDALTDGILLLRGMFGLTDTVLINGALASDATYTTGVEIASEIDGLGDSIDIDGNGTADALTDGLVILRYLFGLRDDVLINGVIASNATLSDASDISAKIESLMTKIQQPALSSAIITSDAFKATGSDYLNLPLAYTCDGVNGGTSPALSWSGTSSRTTHLGLTMHSVNSDGSATFQFSMFNIPSTVTSLAEGDFSIGTVAEGDMTSEEIAAAGGIAYAAPCAAGAGLETLYVFTLYELDAALELTSSATHSDLQTALNKLSISSVPMTTRRIRFDAASLASNLHVPQNGTFNCAEKTAHFNQYSVMHSSISCNESTNQFTVVSHIADGLKTARSDQQLQVGISSWIGRLSLPSQSGSTMRLTPSYLSETSNNISCDGTGVLGFSVDGQVILPYYKQSNNAGIGDTCGPSDGEDYAGRDTVVLGEVDQCYGHSPNGEGYHLHGAPICLMDVHDPSKPVAYMTDGIPLYYGEAGGTIEDTLHAQSARSVTDTNFGAGLYEHLNFSPSDVKDGSNPLNECNAYDINGDGAVSGYAYYSTKDAPYSIGCFMGEVLASGTNAPAANTKLLVERNGWSGQSVGQAINVDVMANYSGSFNGKTYNITEVMPGSSNVPSFLTANTMAQVLWRILDSDDTGYDSSTTCFEFRYRANKSITGNDETEIVCAEKPVGDATLDFTPFGN